MDSDQPARPVRPSPTSYLSAPLLWFNWICQWIAYLASNLAIFTVLDYGGKLAILVTVIWWFVEYPERQREAIRTAWSVVNAKGGGRMENLKYLAERHVDLKGLYAAGGYFSGIALKRQELQGSDLGDANFEGAHLEGAHLEGSDLSGTHFEGAHLNGTQFQNARLYPNAPIFDSASDIGGANFSNIVVANAKEYLAFASALNWKQAAFNEGVK
jgi:Pentapeptide repeats (8 copies)